MVPLGSCYRRQILSSVSKIRDSGMQFESCAVTHTSYELDVSTVSKFRSFVHFVIKKSHYLLFNKFNLYNQCKKQFIGETKCTLQKKKDKQQTIPVTHAEAADRPLYFKHAFYALGKKFPRKTLPIETLTYFIKETRNHLD